MSLIGKIGREIVLLVLRIDEDDFGGEWKRI